MKEKYGAKNPKSLMLRTHAQTAGVSLTAQQPVNNVVRVSLQALAAVLGGTNSLHTNSMDETLSLPTDEAVMVALRTQQIIAEESGVANAVDPLAGSYFVEQMTNKVEKETLEYLKKIDEMGGMISAIDKGYPQAEIANSAYHFQQQVERGEKIIVGVNKYQVEEKNRSIDTLYIDRKVEEEQIAKLKALRSKRDHKKWEASIAALVQDAKEDKNLMPAMMNAVKAYATLEEISSSLKQVYGEYREAGNF